MCNFLFAQTFGPWTLDTPNDIENRRTKLVFMLELRCESISFTRDLLNQVSVRARVDVLSILLTWKLMRKTSSQDVICFRLEGN